MSLFFWVLSFECVSHNTTGSVCNHLVRCDVGWARWEQWKVRYFWVENALCLFRVKVHVKRLL